MKYYLGKAFVNIKDKNEYYAAISDAITGSNKKVFTYLNTHTFHLCYHFDQFSRAFLSADYIYADGYSIVLALKYLKKINIRKIVVSYLFFEELGKKFETESKSIFLLGETEKTLEKAVENLNINFPGIKIAGFSHGYFNDSENEEIVSKINTYSPEVLIVGMGAPKSEIWVQENINKLDVKCILCVGAFIKIAANESSLAPRWLYNTGLEWIHRLLKEPGRLFKRYLVSHSFFIYKFFQLLLFNESERSAPASSDKIT
ncbi:MAG: WecB/TagA/CpsF family glycosyltransferase [Ignavibacteriaceae bacterium]